MFSAISNSTMQSTGKVKSKPLDPRSLLISILAPPASNRFKACVLSSVLSSAKYEMHYILRVS